METGFLNQHDNEYFSSEIFDRSNGFESESSVFNNVISDFELGSSDDWRYSGENLQDDSEDFEKSLNNWRKHISSLKTQDSGIDLIYDSVSTVPNFDVEENDKKFNFDDLCSSANFDSHDLGPDNYDVVEIAVEKDDFFVKKEIAVEKDDFFVKKEIAVEKDDFFVKKEDIFEDDVPTKEESDHIYFSPIKSVPEKTEKVDVNEILPEIFKNIKGKLKNESVRLDHDYCTSDSFPVRIKTENWPSPKKDSGLESGEVSDASETALDKQVKPGESLLRANHIKVENTDSQDTSSQFPPQIHIKEDGTVVNEDGAVVSKKRKLNLDEYRSRRKNMKVKTEPVEKVKVEKSAESDSERVMVNAQVQTADEKKEVKRRRYRSSSSSSSGSSSRSRKYRRRSRSRSRSRTRSRRSRDDHRRRRYSPPSYSLYEKRKQCEERRVVYVGQIEEGTTKSMLRERFQRFGPISDISLHFRERGDNYGFVTFMYKVDAYEAVEHGNDNPAEQKYDICFGGRRAFCQQRYADLDGFHYGQYSSQRNDDSFDAILREAQESLRKKQKYV